LPVSWSAETVALLTCHVLIPLGYRLLRMEKPNKRRSELSAIATRTRFPFFALDIIIS
jgi:hypothetical protein